MGRKGKVLGEKWKGEAKTIFFQKTEASEKKNKEKQSTLRPKLKL